MMSLPTIYLDYLHLLPGMRKGLWAVWDRRTTNYLPQDPSGGRGSLLYLMETVRSTLEEWMTLPDWTTMLGGLLVVYFHFATCLRAMLSLADQPSASECGIFPLC